MRQFDLAPLYRSTVGFDRLFSALDQFASAEAAPTYPPYNIERTGENAYRITVAVAGFTESDLSIEVRENALTLKGERKAEGKAEFLHQGIAARAFERRYAHKGQLRELLEVIEVGIEQIEAEVLRNAIDGPGNRIRLVATHHESTYFFFVVGQTIGVAQSRKVAVHPFDRAADHELVLDGDERNVHPCHRTKFIRPLPTTIHDRLLTTPQGRFQQSKT